jgi:RNA 2',3'-cyclic 3'-phosphodiesterase
MSRLDRGNPILNRDLLNHGASHSPRGFDPSDDFFHAADPGDTARAGTIFFAVQPPPFTASSISRLAWHLRDKHRLTGRPVRPECLHVSLLFAGYHGRMLPETLNAVCQAAATIAMPRFRVGVDWVASFRSRRDRPLVLRGDDGVSGLIALRDRLVAATIGVPGIPAARSEFTPHVTLLYDQRDVREEPVEEIGWPVGEFVLIRSLFGRSRHIVLTSWPLRG